MAIRAEDVVYVMTKRAWALAYGCTTARDSERVSPARHGSMAHCHRDRKRWRLPAIRKQPQHLPGQLH